MQLAANLSWLYPHLKWDKRFQAAAHDGFQGVEILQPYAYQPAWYAKHLQNAELTLTLINTPMGQNQGHMGWAAIPGAQQQFRLAFDQARAVAHATGCKRIHVMAGNTNGLSYEACRATLLHNLDYALALAESDDLILTLEALNRSDIPDYFYHLPEQVLDILRQFDATRLRLQFDFYHCLKEQQDVSASVATCGPWIAYVQIAGVDGRYEPDLHQHDLLNALTALPRLGYNDWLGCEYQPRSLPADNLSWCLPLRELGVLL